MGKYIPALYSIFEEMVLASGDTFLKVNNSPRSIIDQTFAYVSQKDQREYHSLNPNRIRE